MPEKDLSEMSIEELLKEAEEHRKTRGAILSSGRSIRVPKPKKPKKQPIQESM